MSVDIYSMDKVNRLYSETGYMDRYGIHVWITVFICITFFIATSYFYVVSSLKTVRGDWENQKCSPFVIPFAGLIQKTPNMDANEFTRKNFNECLRNTLGPVTKISLSPLKHGLSALASDLTTVGTLLASNLEKLDFSINLAQGKNRNFINEIKNGMNNYYVLFNNFNSILLRMYGVILLIVKEIQGTMTLAQSIGVALVKFVLNLPGGKNIATCFARGTQIVCKREAKPIEAVQVGDILWDGSKVTSTMILSSEGAIFYEVHGVKVTNRHRVFHPTKGWIAAADHPDATLVTTPYEHEYVYCFNTTSKTIKIGETTFADWDEMKDVEFARLRHFFPILTGANMHVILGGGYCKGIEVMMPCAEPNAEPMPTAEPTPTADPNASSCPVQEIQTLKPGQQLRYGEKIYGIVKMMAPEGERYQLLTNRGTFYLRGGILAGDYNTLVEKYL